MCGVYGMWYVRGWRGEELQITNTAKKQGFHRIRLHGSKMLIFTFTFTQ